MINVLEQICAFIHNYFYGDRYSGTFTIKGGILTVDGLLNGQYFRVCGSKLNDGVYQYPAEGLADETFTGEIWPMKVPKAVWEIAAEVEAWQAKYGAAI